MESTTATAFGGDANTNQIDKINELLRGEISAVETYDIAIGRLEANSAARHTLIACRDSHQNRVEMMAKQVVKVGGEPSHQSGPWGAFARTVEIGAAAFGEKLAIAALEEGEDKGLRDYREAIASTEGTTRDLLMRDVLPLQEQTHRMMSQLKQKYATS